MAARSHKQTRAPKDGVLNKLQKCVREGIPVTGGLLLISLPPELVREGESRHVRTVRAEASAAVMGVLKDPYRRLAAMV